MFGSALNYVTLRSLGEGANDGEGAMEKGRKWILDHGGATAITSWGKFWLSVLGVFEWPGNNSLPPEMWLLPFFLSVHPGRMWCHCRMVYLPMSYLYGKRFVGRITSTVLALRKELFTVPYHDIDWNEARNLCAKVYDVKVSFRSKLHILQTIRSKLSWKGDQLDIFTRTVFGPWLNIQTTLHDNHLLNFLLQHQRRVRNPSPNKPFIFDIDGRTLEFGRKDFCLITSFRFSKVNLDPKEEDHSKFRKRVFPKIGNLKGKHLLALVNKDVNKLDDEDVIRVCLLLALDFVFMGHELRHAITNPIVNLVDDFYKWDAFP
ncbi:cycloartenol synthase [Tanacetum coccineum]